MNDPTPYDDTGWTLGALHNVKTIRVTDAGILKAPMTVVASPAKFEGSVSGGGSAVAYLINDNTDNTLFTFRYRLKNVKMSAAETSLPVPRPSRPLTSRNRTILFRVTVPSQSRNRPRPGSYSNEPIDRTTCANTS